MWNIQWDWQGWESKVAVLSGVAMAASFLFKFLFLPMLRYIHKKAVGVIVDEVMKNLQISTTIEAALNKHFTPNGGKNLYDRIEKILQSQVAIDAKLNRNEQMNRSMLNSQQIAYWESGARGECIYASPALCNTMGRSEQEITGHNWRNCIHPDDREDVVEQWQWSVDNNSKFDKSYRVVRNDKQVVHVHASAYALHDAEGRTIGFYGAMTKIPNP